LKKVLVVDDLKAARATVEMALEGIFQVFMAENGEDAMTIYEREEPQAVFLDYELPGALQGGDILKRFREQDSHVFIVMITGRRDLESRLLREGADYFLPKPFRMDQVKALLLNRWGEEGSKPSTL
jgi:DNA-binding response OmpR family regulator